MAYSRNGQPFGLSVMRKGYWGAPINSGVPVLDQDINLMHNIMDDRMAVLWDATFTNGFRVAGGLGNYGVNVLELTPAFIEYNSNYALISDTAVAGTNRITLETTVGRPVGQTYDIIFLEMWYEEVREDGIIYEWGNTLHYNPSFFTNDIVDPAVGIPATTRVQLRYRIRAVAEVDGTDPVATIMTSDPVTIQGKKSAPEATGNPLFNFDENFQDGLSASYYANDTANDSPVYTGGFAELGEYGDIGRGIVLAFPIALIERTVGDDDVGNGTVTNLQDTVRHRVNQFTFPVPVESQSENGTWESVEGSSIPFAGSPVTLNTLNTTTGGSRAIQIQCSVVLNNTSSTSQSGDPTDTIRLYRGGAIVRQLGWESTDLLNDEVSISYLDPAPAANQTYRLEGISLTGVSITAVRSNMIAFEA